MSVEFGQWLDEHEDAILNIYSASPMVETIV